MDYQKHYEQLIETRKKRRTRNKAYYEKHHIIPKCKRGGDDKENLVKLTAKEHFIAHLLLWRIFPSNKKLAYAFWIMCCSTKKKRDYTINSRIYEKIRKEIVYTISKDRIEYFSNPENRKKGSIETKKGMLKSGASEKLSIATKNWHKTHIHHMQNKHHTKEANEKNRQAKLEWLKHNKHPMQDKHHTQEANEKNRRAKLEYYKTHSVWNKGKTT